MLHFIKTGSKDRKRFRGNIIGNFGHIEYAMYKRCPVEDPGVIEGIEEGFMG